MSKNQQEMINDLRAKRYWLHEELYKAEKYIETIEETQRLMIDNNLDEEVLYLLPQETLEIVKRNTIQSRELLKKLIKHTCE